MHALEGDRIFRGDQILWELSEIFGPGIKYYGGRAVSFSLIMQGRSQCSIIYSFIVLDHGGVTHMGIGEELSGLCPCVEKLHLAANLISEWIDVH